MIVFQVDDMSCGHCVGAVTKAVKSVDAAAGVRVDLAAHRVEIEPAAADAPALRATLREAIQEAGYTPIAL